MNIQELPPKMTAQYAERAKRGDYEYKMQSPGQLDENATYLWFVGNQKVCLIGYTTPTGHIEKIAQHKLQQTKDALAFHRKVT